MNEETGADRAQFTKGPRRIRGPIFPMDERQAWQGWAERVTDRCLAILIAFNFVAWAVVGISYQ